jgi:asparagine synthetase B (glutamine-hydrolysing)
MCGIFGFITRKSIDEERARFIIRDLFLLSESRGKEAAGIFSVINDTIDVCKAPMAPSLFIQSDIYRSFMKRAFSVQSNASLRAFIGHCRLMTNGDITDNMNNQPIVTHGVVGVHNGIIANFHDLWQKINETPSSNVDSELLFSLLRYYSEKSQSLAELLASLYADIEGTASFSAILDTFNSLILATNSGSLYVSVSSDSDSCAFSSEEFILKSFLKRKRTRYYFSHTQTFQLASGEACVINLSNLSVQKVNFMSKDGNDVFSLSSLKRPRAMTISGCFSSQDHQKSTPIPTVIFNQNDFAPFEYDPSLNHLKRCTRCVLPVTMPFITFDNEGVCNYCHSYKKIKVRTREELETEVARRAGALKNVPCLVALSGGRDSCYGLHYIKTVLKMKPTAYTYDWGMVSDLARRNQARMCGKLGIEHIIVSADIEKKRSFIRKNIEAWLRKPELGIIPLFMAGDKMFFYYANQIMKQTNMNIMFFCENNLEKTDFKSGFCGVNNTRSTHDKTHTLYSTPLQNKIILAKYYALQFVRNYHYCNESLIDTVQAYISTYFLPHEYLLLFNYVPWDERTIVDTLVHDYNWELAHDTKSSWRIGDATVPFYNYIYYRFAGFTENDTFRSNQIREGVISRSEALRFITEENRPRLQSIKEYLDLIHLDFKTVMQRIDKHAKELAVCSQS